MSKNTFFFFLGRLSAFAEEDEIDEDDYATIEEEGGANASKDEEDLDESGEKKNVSPNADTQLLFTRPSVKAGSVELPAGNIVEFLVGELELNLRE